MSLSSYTFEIDKDSSVPIYHQLQLGLIELIESGHFAAGQPIPSETRLSQTFDISPMTVRQAMSELVQKGYIRRERGRGSFVLPRRMEHQLDRLVGFSEDMRARHLHPHSRILLLETISPPDDLREQVEFLHDSTLIRLKRLRLVEDQPVGVHDAYLAGVEISRDDLTQTPSLYDLIAQKGILLGEAQDNIEAIAADKETASLLQTKVGSPALRTTRLSWDVYGQFVEYVVSIYRADLYEYNVRLKRA